MLVNDLEREKLTELLGRLAKFCGVDVITNCVMSDHFPLLIRVPVRVELSDAELLVMMVKFYGKNGVLTVLTQEGLKLRGRIDANIRESVVRRMGAVSAFMQEVKQRFTRWYNKAPDVSIRYGPTGLRALWWRIRGGAANRGGVC